MFETYAVAFAGVWLALLTMLLQHLIAIGAHRKQAQYVPGVVDAQLGHDSFVFRSHRTYQNSLANTPLMLATALLAMVFELSPTLVAASVWVYALARIAHMVLYYAIATERNPSPRSYFFVLGTLANLVLMLAIPVAWL
ncbi:MAPEG family protein [Ferrimonas balearica]|uniref:MAPEG family protein n=1 Tax=Ferrimonas balearica TaxID=44012 RepID=UPI001C99A20C|nr:MAPEG family protein [Ferrimonas balearica]MBY5991987.1 MAPEG family protein [Ferrimonas balearica]